METKVNDRFEFRGDRTGWVLTEWVDGVKKTGEPKKVKFETYYPNLTQICQAIIDRSAQGKTVEDVVEAIRNAALDIKSTLRGLGLS